MNEFRPPRFFITDTFYIVRFTGNNKYSIEEQTPLVSLDNRYVIYILRFPFLIQIHFNDLTTAG